jgi:site-specific DNA-cytosine methylase
MKQCALKIFEMWWTKSRRAQNVDDYETWISGGVVPTLNVFDNASETRATVLILFEPKSLFEENWAEAKVKNALRANASKSSHLIIDGTRVNDVRVYEDGIVPTVISRYGTGGGNVPMVYPIQGTMIGRSDTAGPQGKGYSDDQTMFTLTKTDVHAVSENKTVRRLTPIECERLQGFPDDWTSGQADSNRYKQMGNAVAVPVVEWIIGRLVAQIIE